MRRFGLIYTCMNDFGGAFCGLNAKQKRKSEAAAIIDSWLVQIQFMQTSKQQMGPGNFLY